ncbi:hypothetical protein Calkr_2085 [Caldicellulosiruptor acetigenus I77R1B]|uniref:Primosome, DnaD subunit n=1 Tax=Caldicellulosiruptor acetigenus (strain ATCC 700853 / DSM 12137 / I77R1B) TaxID=632335 RepID=E4S5B9_CALA7|nr:hypothetical protein [Caldicellulosiruptor acetigenus]ADQ41553.1 hypothetical protein Calkr_2085 [Caldicellulosiruptor acetigenus I77R1B]
MRYTQIYSQIWYDEKFKQLSNNAKLAFIYILSSPHSNMAGYYRLPVAYISYDMQWEKETVLEALNELENYNMIAYDTKNEIVLVKNFLKYNLIQNTNQAKGILRHIKEIPKSHLLIELAESIKKYASNYLNVFEELFRTVESMKESLLENPDNPLERVSKGFKNPSQTVKEGFQNGSERVSEGLENSSERVFRTSGNTLETLSEPIQNPSPKQNNNKQKQNQKQNNIESVIANAITPRTGSDKHTCVTEEHETSTSTQEKKLEGEQGMAVTSEPEQVTDIVEQPKVNNALITTGEEEIEQLLEEFFENEEAGENQETAETNGHLVATGECERKKPSVPVEVPEDQETAKFTDHLNTTGVELKDSGECNILQQDQDTAITQDHLIADEEEEIEQLLEEFFAGVPDQAGAPPSTMPADILPAGDTGTTANNPVNTNTGSQQEINTDGTHTVSNSGVATAVASRDAPACVPVNTDETEDYQEEPVEKAPEVTNQDLIGILTHKFHEITKPLKHRSDYSYIGGLYNKFNYFIVDSALDRLKRKVERDGPMDSMKSYRAYLTRVCMNINQECVDPAGAQKQRKQYSKARTLKVSTEEIKKQIETQATLF